MGEYADIRLSRLSDGMLKGRISNILPILDPNIRTAKVRLEVENPGFMRLGMFVTATFHGLQAEKHATVPATAILHLHDRDWVYMPAENGRFRRVEVVGGNMLPGNMQEVVGHPAGRAGGSECAGTPEHGGTIDDSQAGRFRPEEPLSRSRGGAAAVCGGAISFHQLPVEAYPDVANNYVEIITQWPGISAEQIEQQVTIPLEIVMNGIPQVTHLRSFSLFGLSDLKLIFDDEADNSWNREKSSRAAVPGHCRPESCHRWGPTGVRRADLLLHAAKHNPAYDVMELKSIEDWVVEKHLKSVPNIVDVASFGGPTREYQVRVDPNKLIAYGLNLAQVEQQLSNNNVNAGGSFIEAGHSRSMCGKWAWSGTCMISKTPFC